jgi:hypothetical protein
LAGPTRFVLGINPRSSSNVKPRAITVDVSKPRPATRMPRLPRANLSKTPQSRGSEFGSKCPYAG